jgi:hypothetical protein
MSSICYRWDDTPFPWNECPFTWKEGCIIEKLVGYGTAPIRERIKKLTVDEKETLIKLFVRLDVEELIFETTQNKSKNKKVKVKLKDVEVLMKEQKIIKVNVKINE